MVVLVLGVVVVGARLPKRRSSCYDVAWSTRLALLGVYLLTLVAVAAGAVLCVLFGSDAFKLME